MCKKLCMGGEGRHYAFHGNIPDDGKHQSTEDELRMNYTTVKLNRKEALEAGGMPVLSDGRTVTINTGDEMSIIFGATGTKKTRVLISPLVAINALAGESMIIPDVKGELTSGAMSAKVMGILKKKNYNIRILNFRTLDGDGYDILGEAYEEYNEGDRDEAAVMLHKLVDNLSAIYKGSSTEPIWTETAKAYLMAVMVLLCRLCDNPEEFNLLSLASYTSEDSCHNLERLAELLDQKDNVMTMLRSVLSEPDRTRMSTLATVSSFFSVLIINEKMLRMLSRSTFRLEELYEEKTALFIVMPDEVDTYGTVVGLILSQISAFLVKKAYELGGQLPRRVNYICDEFNNYFIPGMEKNISAHRSRNIRWYLVCQGKNQLERAYPREYGTILSNCTNIYFTGSPDTSLLEELSERSGFERNTEDGCLHPRVCVWDLRKMKKGRDASEVYFSSGEHTCITTLPDIDQYEFLQEFTERPAKVSNRFRKLPVYDSEQMLKDVYDMKKASKARQEGKRLSEKEKKLVEKYEKIFQEND